VWHFRNSSICLPNSQESPVGIRYLPAVVEASCALESSLDHQTFVSLEPLNSDVANLENMFCKIDAASPCDKLFRIGPRAFVDL
jgi:hypothetical protein